MAEPKKIIRTISLSLAFLALLLFFTLTKLPQAKLTNLIQGYVQVALDPYGLYITDHGRELSVWSGFQYTLTQPTLELSDQTRIELDEIVVRPSFTALISGQAGATLAMKQGNARVDFKGAGRGDQISTSLQFDQIDIGKFGLLSFAGGIKGSGTVNGHLNVDGRLSDPTSLNGEIHLKLAHVKLEEQTLMGFQLPAMNISDGTIEVAIEHGKMLMKSVQLGKSADDIQLSVTGDITLNRNLNSSVLNVRTVLGFSDKVKQTLTLIDSIMGVAKQNDGRYAYKINGNFGAPFPVPDPQK